MHKTDIITRTVVAFGLLIATCKFLFILSTVYGFAQEELRFEAEDWSKPEDAWEENITPVDKWNLWSKDTDADKKWSGGVVLQSPPVLEDRKSTEEGAPVLHTVIKGIPKGVWNVSVKHARALAVSLNGREWKNLVHTKGKLGTFEIKDGKFEFWVDDRFAYPENPGFSYYDCVIFTPVLPVKIEVVNGNFESGDDIKNSSWSWWSRDNKGNVEFSSDAKLGKRSVKIFYDGEKDWAFLNAGRLDVKPGEVWIVSGWAKCQNTKIITLAVVALSKGKILSWDIGSAGLEGTKDWTRLEATAFIPEGCDQIYVRFVGLETTCAWVDDVGIKKGELKPRVAKPKIDELSKKRIEEKMDRGLITMPVEGGKIYLSWRLLRDDSKDIVFNVYRQTDKEKPIKLNAQPIKTTTDFIDDAPLLDRDNKYFIKPVIDGKELESSEQYLAPANSKPSSFISIKTGCSFQKVGIADLNGDGCYDFVIKQPNENIDPYVFYWKQSKDTHKLEAYLHDGKLLWRKDLGWAIEQGIWYSPYVVYDLDGDGKAEVAVKTGEGDPRDSDGRVREGPEYLSILDGITGKEITRTDWLSREGLGDYNYFSRNQIGIAYLDGKTPSLMVARGTYKLMKLEAYQYKDGNLKKLWYWDSREEGVMSPMYHGQGAHFMHSADVDNDGRDEVILGSCVIDDNGQALWSTGLGHPDYCYVGDIDPSRPGLEIYYGIERSQPSKGVCLVDAKTGEIIWGINERTYHVGTSLCSDIDPFYPGLECYSGEDQKGQPDMPKDKLHRWLHSAKGELLANEKTLWFGGCPRTVYWDADPQRELVSGKKIFDYLGIIHTDKIEGSEILWADILGDWREEIITSYNDELRIYTTTIPANDRRTCLMQDPIYRLDVAHLAMGYAQPPMTSFCIDKGSAVIAIELPPSKQLKIDEIIEGKILVRASLEEIAGQIKLEAGEFTEVDPKNFKIKVQSGQMVELPFKIKMKKKPQILQWVREDTIVASFQDTKLTLNAKASVRIEDVPLKEGIMVQAEDFSAQGGGEVKIREREEKLGAVGKSFSHWDSKGHWLQWNIDLPEDGEYLIVLRYCSLNENKREIIIDSKEPITQTFSSTGGFSSDIKNDWFHTQILGIDGKPLILKLSKGKHIIKMTNLDEQGMNLDYIAIVKSGRKE